MPAASTTTLSVQVLDFEDMRLLIQRGRLYAISVRQASVLPAASFRSCFAAGTLAVRLTVPLAGSVRDFHSQVSAPCRAHKRKGQECGQTFLPLRKAPQLPNQAHHFHGQDTSAGLYEVCGSAAGDHSRIAALWHQDQRADHPPTDAGG